MYSRTSLKVAEERPTTKQAANKSVILPLKSNSIIGLSKQKSVTFEEKFVERIDIHVDERVNSFSESDSAEEEKESMKREVSSNNLIQKGEDPIIKPVEENKARTSINRKMSVLNSERRISLVVDPSQEENVDQINKKEEEIKELRRHSKYSLLLRKAQTSEEDVRVRNIVKDPSDLKKNSLLSIFQYSTCYLMIENSREKSEKIIKFTKGPTVVKDDPNEIVFVKEAIHTSLSQRMKKNFERAKIKNLEMPEKVESLTGAAFIREKSHLTQEVNRLHNQIRMSF